MPSTQPPWVYLMCKGVMGGCIKDIRLMSEEILCQLRQEPQGNNAHRIKLEAECLAAAEIMMRIRNTKQATKCIYA